MGLDFLLQKQNKHQNFTKNDKQPANTKLAKSLKNFKPMRSK